MVSLPLVSSVVLGPQAKKPKTGLLSDEERERLMKLTGYNYTPNEWRRYKTTLETSGEDIQLHSRRVEKI